MPSWVDAEADIPFLRAVWGHAVDAQISIK